LTFPRLLVVMTSPRGQASPEPGTGGASGRPASRDRMLAALTDRDDRIADLELEVEKHQARIQMLEASGGGEANSDALHEEISELRSIVDAQEQALDEQRRIISEQSQLIEDLNSALQSRLAIEAAEAEVPPSPSASTSSPHASSVPPRAPGGRMSTGTGSTASSGAPPRQQRPSGGAGQNTSRSGAPPAASTARAHPASAPAAPGSQPLSARSQNVQREQREQREQILAKQRGQQQQSPRAAPKEQRPRPNSSLGRPNGAPRARSLTERTSSPTPASGSQGSAQQLSRRSSAGLQNGEPARAAYPGVARKGGGPVGHAPALPRLLRHEAL